MKPKPQAEADKTDFDALSIEDLMADLSPEDRSNADDDGGGPDIPGQDDEPTEDLLAPELLFPSGSTEKADKDG